MGVETVPSDEGRVERSPNFCCLFLLGSACLSCIDLVMESFHSSFVARNAEYELNESDVPGASLKVRNPRMLTVPELKRWLACRGALRGGRKADVVLRVSSYIQEGLDKRIIDPDGGQNVERKRQKLV